MRKLLLQNKWYVLLLIGLIVAEPTVNSVLNFWLQGFFNEVKPGADKTLILRLLTFGFLLWMTKRLVSFTSAAIKTRYICKAREDVKHRMFANIMGMNTANIGEIASSGEYISLFTNDIMLVEQRFFNQVIGLVSSVVSILILGFSFVAMNKMLAFSILAFGVCTMFVPAFFSDRLNRKNVEYSEGVSHFTQQLKEYLIAYPTIKNFSIEERIVRHFSGTNSDTEWKKFEAEYALNMANNAGQLLAWFMQFIAVGLGVMLVVKGEIMLGTVIAAQSFASDVASPLQNLIININSIRSVKRIVQKIEAFSTGAPAPAGTLAEAEPAPRDLPEPAACDVSFRGLTLKVGDREIIHDFTYDFRHGRKYLIVGMNGAGKSTLFKTLKKWFSHVEGSITIGGRDIRGMQSSEISRYVSYLNENVSLFSDSVRENITLYRDVPPDRFSQAVQDAQIHLDLERTISDEGRNISSGERRRIEVARSLVEAVPVLVFDEVVSTLDIETAYEFEQMALSFADKTVIFISHNFSGKLIDRYDDILVMADGRLLAHGSFEELNRTCDYFRHICQIKFGWRTPET